MSTPAQRGDPVDERHVLQLLAIIRQRDDNLPAVGQDLVDSLLLWSRILILREVQIAVAVKGLDRQARPVQVDGHVRRRQGGQVVDSARQQGHCIRVQTRHAKARIVRQEGHPDVRPLGAGPDARLPDDRHVGLEPLGVDLLADGIDGLHLKPGAVDVAGLGADAVLASDQLVLRVVVVGRGQHVSKDELGNPDFPGFLWRIVDFHGNSVAVVLDRDDTGFNVKGHGNALGLGLRVGGGPGPDAVVQGVGQDLVHDLVEARHVAHRAADHSALLLVEDPGPLGILWGDGADVHARPQQHVLPVVELLERGRVHGAGFLLFCPLSAVWIQNPLLHARRCTTLPCRMAGRI